MTSIAERWAAVRARVDAACERAGRAPSEVTIVAVSKTHSAAAVREAAAAGATDFGENYAQELVAKRGELADLQGIRWHYIGRLQSNKAKMVAGHVTLVHAVDSVSLATELGKRAGSGVQPILITVNAAGEDTKGGVTHATAPDLARALAAVPNVRLDGLMTMPPPSDDPEASRPFFVALRELRDRIADDLGKPLPVLSMGMSGDYEVAIACGSTHVRIGTAIFGAR
ncbi:MAG TPA: YggS family pyridoxal phosphate-dependent enzyme [Kofleriaceae bacterium]|jgi:pyridoxal phosphate enzyme (YggS family)|nr:YggS family pyridoxal phosphate-dependent enzyme [Kofleriaceae bacterium]